MVVNVTQRYLDGLAPALSERDRAIVEVVGRFKLVSADQIERLFFSECSGRSRARARQAVLRRLVERQVLLRVGSRRVGGARGGSAGWIYTLDVAGLRLFGATSARPRRPLTDYAPSRLHYLAVAELYVRLREAEVCGELTLLAFETEPYCWRTFGTETLKPDAFVVIGVEKDDVRRKRSCFIEVDRAEEWGAKISGKLPVYLRYREYESLTGKVFPQVVFLAPHERRVVYLERLVASAQHRASIFQVHRFDDAVAELIGDSC